VVKTQGNIKTEVCCLGKDDMEVVIEHHLFASEVNGAMPQAATILAVM